MDYGLLIVGNRMTGTSRPSQSYRPIQYGAMRLANLQIIFAKPCYLGGIPLCTPGMGYRYPGKRACETPNVPVPMGSVRSRLNLYNIVTVLAPVLLLSYVNLLLDISTTQKRLILFAFFLFTLYTGPYRVFAVPNTLNCTELQSTINWA